MIDWEDVLKTADELGIKYEKIENGQCGFYVTNEDGAERRITIEELFADFYTTIEDREEV